VDASALSRGFPFSGVLGGEYEIQCGNQLIKATSGTFVFLPRDVPNKYPNITDLPATFLYITSPGGFERFIEKVDLMAKTGLRAM
jgi:hypothetical protein